MACCTELKCIGTVRRPVELHAADLMEAIRKDHKIEVRHSLIVGDVDLRDAKHAYRVTITDSVFTGHFDATDAHFEKSVDLSRCTFWNNLALVDAEFDRSLLLSSATIYVGEGTAFPAARSGTVSKAGAGKDGPEINFDRLRVAGLLEATRLITNASLSLPNAVLKGGIQIRGAYIGGRLLANDAEIGGDWDAASDSDAPKPLRTAIAGDVSLVGIRTHGQVIFSGARVEGYLSLQSAEIMDLFCRAKTTNDDEWPTDIRGRVSLSGAKVTGQVVFGGARIRGENVSEASALNLQGVELGGSLYCTSDVTTGKRTEIQGRVSLISAKVGGRVFLEGTRVQGDLLLRNASIEGDLAFAREAGTPIKERTEILGDVILVGAKVRGDVICDALDTRGKLDLEGAEIGGKFACRSRQKDEGAKLSWLYPSLGQQFADVPAGLDAGNRRMEVRDGVSMHGAKIGGDIVLEAAQVTSLSLQHAEVEGDVCCATGNGGVLTILGSAHFGGTRVHGAMRLEGALIREDLDLDGIEIDRGLVCSPKAPAKDGNAFPTCVGNAVRLTHARVRGDTTFESCLLGPKSPTDSGGDAARRSVLDLCHSELDGDFFFGHSAHYPEHLKSIAQGSVRLNSATLNGNVHLGSTHIEGDLNLEDAHVLGEVNLSQAVVDHDLNMRSARIEGAIFGQVTEGTCPNVNGRVLLGSAQLREVQIFFSDDGRHPRSVELEQADIGKLEIVGKLPAADPSAGRPAPLFRCDGMTFRQLDLRDQGGRASADNRTAENAAPKKDYVSFLRRCDFSKSTYLSVEEWLRDRGDDEDANKVYLAMRRRDIGVGMPLTQRPLHWLLYYAVGHGVRTLPLWLLFFLLFFTSFQLFRDPWSVEHPVTFNVAMTAGTAPVPGTARLPEKYEAGHPKAKDWDWVDALWIAMRYQLPMISLVAEDDWKPSPKPVSVSRCCPQAIKGRGPTPAKWLSYESYASTVSMLNWIIVPLLLASVTGLLKRQK